MSGAAVPAPIITGLYVPGDRPDRFDKAVATGAQLVILDLEDAVAPDRKALARSEVAAWLAARRPVEPGSAGAQARDPLLQVRINAGSAEDLAVLAGIDAEFGLRVPKVEGPRDLDRIAELMPNRRITALLESATAVENAAATAGHPSVAALAIGESDLASDLGTRAEQAMDYARVRVLFAARAAGLPAPMLAAFPDIRNLDALRADTERGRALGSVGRTAIHPSQLAVIAEVFRPTASETAWAREVLDAMEAGGVVTLRNGEMVDAAMIGRAESILARAGAQATR